MKKRKRHICLFATLIVTSFFFIGCNKENNEKKVELKLSQGAVAKEANGEYKIYDYINNAYSKVDLNKTITAFDKKSLKYLYNSEGKNYIYSNGKEIPIEDDKVISSKISSGGKYVSYFTGDPILEVKLLDVEKNKNIEFNSNVAISGDFLDWLDEETIVYYGIDNNKRNGIFMYNISEKKEELLYKLEVGYIEFFKVSGNGVIFLQETTNKKKVLKSVDKNKNVAELTKDVLEVNDIIIINDAVYMLGKMVDNNYSIYKIEGGKFKRLVFDFPTMLHLEKGLSQDEKGNLLFVGSNESFEKENVYLYENGEVKYLTNDNSKYYFIRFS
ncbi:hypothetical protein JCM1393_28050 [Clostridium carnis]